MDSEVFQPSLKQSLLGARRAFDKRWVWFWWGVLATVALGIATSWFPVLKFIRSTLLFAAVFVIVSHQIGYFNAKVKLLLESSDLRAIGPMLDSLSFGQGGFDNKVRDALVPLLCQVRPEHANLFDSRQVEALSNQLKASKKPNVIEALLTAIKSVSGSEAVPALEHFEQDASNKNNEKWAKLVERARLVLAEVRDRSDGHAVAQNPR